MRMMRERMQKRDVSATRMHPFHLDTIAVAEGQIVARGETLGTVGMTGRGTGPHLHFCAQVGAARVDPAVLLGLRADRVPD